MSSLSVSSNPAMLTAFAAAETLEMSGPRGALEAVDLSPPKQIAPKQSASTDAVRDDVLIARTCSGDQRAFKTLMDRYQGKVYNHALAMLRHPVDAQDIVQEVFLKVHRNLDRFEGRSRFETWLTRITINTCNEHLRKKKVRGGDRVDGDDVLVGQPSEDRPWDHRLSDRQMIGLIMATEGVAFNLLCSVELEGMPYPELAESLGLTVGALKVRVHRARERVAKTAAGCI